jgi:PAS domain S-box-containing protein
MAGFAPHLPNHIMNASHQNESPASNEALRASELSYRRLFEAAKDGILILDVDTGRITDVNPFLFKLLGFSRDEMIGKTVGELSPFKDIESNQAMLERLQKNEYVRYEDLPLETRDGRHIAVEFVSNVYEAGDKKVIQCNIRDITKRKKSEQRMAQLNREANEARVIADTANLVKSEFLANMSHELRTPLGVVIGLANILALSRPLTVKQTEYVSTLKLSATSLLALINDLLDISKIESRSVELEKVPFTISEVMGEVARMMSLRVTEKRISFTVDDQTDKRDEFLGDPMRLRRILLNLCGNAIKFTDQGTVRVTITSEATNETTRAVAVAVADTGIGIAGDKLGSVFDKFVQAETSMSRRFGGTGLGLTISKTLAELMGGSIQVESVVGKGSIFTLNIPLQLTADDVAISEGSPKLEETPPFRATILLVEDHQPNILVTTAYLEMLGIDCDVVRNGREALEKIASRPYALVLLDVQMAVMDGLEATRQIRARERMEQRPRLPIIGMTAYALAGDRQRCMDAGMDEYISKPFEPEELKLKVFAILENSMN